MNTGQILKSKSVNRFTVISNEIAQSKTLTMEEKGLLVYLLSLPSDWVLYKTKLAESMGERPFAVDRVFKGLQQKGYIISVKQVDGMGRFMGWNHIVYDEPNLPNRDQEKLDRLQENPKSDLSEIGQTAPIQTHTPPTKTKEIQKDVVDKLFSEFLSYLNKKTGRAYRGDAKSKAHFSARIKSGWKPEDFVKAIDNVCSDAYHIETKFKYITPEFMTREDKLDRFCQSSTPPKPVHPPTLEINPWTGLPFPMTPEEAAFRAKQKEEQERNAG